MELKVTNFMGCESAVIPLDRITLVAGDNFAGKSSLCRAAGAALAGDTIPVDKVKKSEAGALVRSGAAKGEVSVVADTGTATVTWPKAERYTEGTPPFASMTAVGRVSLVTMDAGEAVNALTALLDADPTRDDLQAALADAKVSDKVLSKIWEAIERDGWDKAHERAVQKGREFKAQWAYCTGDNYGAKKADGWTPGGWDESLGTESQDGLEAKVTAARAELEDALGRQAVDDDTRQRLQDEAADLDAALEAVTAAEAKVEEAQATAAAAEEARAKLPASDNDAGQPCPHCGEPVVIETPWKGQPTLKAAETVDEATLKERRAAIASADGKAENARSALSAAKGELSAAQSAAGKAKRSRDRLDELAKKPKGQAVDVDAKREELRKAEADLGAFNKKYEADRLHRNVMTNQAIIDALAQTGVRRSVLLKKLQGFNLLLQDITDAAGWRQVEITGDMSVELAGRSYFLLSDSEQYRVRRALQVAVAHLDDSQCLVIDAADILDGAGREGLLTMLHKRGVRALVTMTLPGPDRAPDLAAMGAGHVFWLDGGKSAEFRKGEAA